MPNLPVTYVLLIRDTNIPMHPKPTLEKIHRCKGQIVKHDLIIIIMPPRKIKNTRYERMRNQGQRLFSFTNRRSVRYVALFLTHGAPRAGY